MRTAPANNRHAPDHIKIIGTLVEDARARFTTDQQAQLWVAVKVGNIGPVWQAVQVLGATNAAAYACTAKARTLRSGAQVTITAARCLSKAADRIVLTDVLDIMPMHIDADRRVGG